MKKLLALVSCSAVLLIGVTDVQSKKCTAMYKDCEYTENFDFVTEGDALMTREQVKENVKKDSETKKVSSDSLHGAGPAQRLGAKIDQKAHSLKENIKEGAHETKERAQELGEKVSEKAHALKENIKEGAHHTKENAQRLGHNIEHKAHDAKEQAQGKLHNFAEGTKEVAHNLKDKVAEKAHDLKEGTRGVFSSIKHRAELVKDKIETIGERANCDVAYTQDKLFIEIALPGIKKRDIHIEIETDAVRINAERHAKVYDKKGCYVAQQEINETLKRVITFPVIVDAHRAAAHIEDGLLTIEIPRVEKAPVVRHTLTVK